MPPTIFLCTVGGSHEPILTAIRATSPNYLCFICSGKDLATGKPGSNTQILGKGNIIKKSFTDDKPILPNIPTQAGLNADQFSAMAQAGLFTAWQLVGQLTSGPASLFAKTQLEAMRGRVELRNQSILAHGFTPIAAAEWHGFSQFIAQHMIPMLLKETADLRLQVASLQLPTNPVW